MSRVAVVTGAGRGIGREVAKHLGHRGYAVLATDVDEGSARDTAEALGEPAWAMGLDVRDPEAHRAAAAEAVERGRLEVWVNNAGVIRTQKVWDHSDDEIRLMAEANLLGVMWGSRAAVDAMRTQVADGAPCHLVNMASMSSLGPVPGMAVYGATKHGVLGFSESLQGDLEGADIPIRVHAVCPDAVETDMVRERRDDPESALIWSGPRLLSAEEVAERIVGLLDSRQLVLVMPRWRGWLARTIGLMPRVGLRLAGPLKRLGERQRQRQ
jgi:NAD(P)-dependent dehydrogenase (short-subunit alcohol dehydrogenase family)